MELPATVTFDYPTPAALAAFVHSQLPQHATAETGGSTLPGWGSAPSRGGNRGRGRSSAAGRVVKGAAANSKQQRSVAILEQLADVVAGVLGAAVPPDQPLMEVSVCVQSPLLPLLLQLLCCKCSQHLPLLTWAPSGATFQLTLLFHVSA